MGIDGQKVTTGLFSDVGVRNHVGNSPVAEILVTGARKWPHLSTPAQAIPETGFKF